MGTSARVVTPIGESLVVAAALGKSLGTLLGPTDARKIVYQKTFQDSGYETISSDPVALLRAMDVVHPVGVLVLEALEGMEVAFGTGASSLVTLCGVLSTAFRELKEQGLPSSATLRGLQMAEDICVNVLRGLSIPIDELTEDFQTTPGHQRHERVTRTPNNVEEDFQQDSRVQSQATIRMPFLMALAAGLEHSTNTNCCNTTATKDWGKRSGGSRIRQVEESTDDKHLGLSLPAALAVQAVAALLVPSELGEGSRNAVVLPDIARVRTRLVVGPASAVSFVAPGAVIVEVPPWQKAAAADAFITRGCTSEPQAGEKSGSPSFATATTHVQGVVVVLGDVCAGAGASSAATIQTPVTSVFRGGGALLARSTASSNAALGWAEEASRNIERLRVEALVATGEVCPSLQQVLASRGVLVLSGASKDEAEMAALASGATPVSHLDDVTIWDVGRGPPKAEHYGEEIKDEPIQDSRRCTGFSDAEQRADKGESHEGVRPSPFPCCERHGSDLDGVGVARCPRPCSGMAVSLLEIGTTSDGDSKFVPTSVTRVGPGLSTPDVVLLLHQPDEATADACDGYSGRGARQEAATLNECQAGSHATVCVVLCGPTPSTCEELRHRFWRVVRRLAGALSERLVLPGAGACEVVCASTLELEAARLEKEIADNISHSVPAEMYTPTVLRSTAAALDNVVLTCLANAGHSGSSALHRLTTAKKAVTRNLISAGGWHDRPSGPSKDSGASASPPGLDLSCLKWGFCLDLAVVVVALPDPKNDELTAESSWEDLEGLKNDDLGCSAGSCLCHGKGRTMVFDNFGAKVGCFERAVGLVGLLAGTDGMLLAPPPS